MIVMQIVRQEEGEVRAHSDNEDLFYYDEELDSIDVPSSPSSFDGATILDNNSEGKIFNDLTNVDNQCMVVFVERVVSLTKQAVDDIGLLDDDFMV